MPPPFTYSAGWPVMTWSMVRVVVMARPICPPGKANVVGVVPLGSKVRLPWRALLKVMSLQPVNFTPLASVRALPSSCKYVALLLLMDSRPIPRGPLTSTLPVTVLLLPTHRVPSMRKVPPL